MAGFRRSNRVGRRAGKHAGELIFQDRLAFVRRNRVRLAFLLVAYPCFAILFGLWFHFFAPFFVPFIVGGASVGFAWFVSWFLDMDNSHFRRRGLWAEQWTTKTLKKKLGNEWSIFDDMPFASGNVDHVLIGPGGIYAVETKWRSGSIRRYPLSQESFRRESAQAWQGARSVERLLRGNHIGLTIRPVLILWGPGTPEQDDATRQYGRLIVLIGDRADDWVMKVLQRDRATSEQIEAATRTIDGYLADQPSLGVRDFLWRPIRIIAALLPSRAQSAE
jgi:hypothetical protein